MKCNNSFVLSMCYLISYNCDYNARLRTTSAYYIILQLDCASAIINILHHYRGLRVVCLPATECQRVAKQHG